MKITQFPKARTEDLVVQNLDNETLVYDVRSNKAHCLNETAAFVWEQCDGSTDRERISKAASGRFSDVIDRDFVDLALDQLGQRDLLMTSVVSSPSRREVLKKIGIASSVALPLIVSITAPSSALANANCACTSPANCTGFASCPSTVNCNAAGVCAP